MSTALKLTGHHKDLGGGFMVRRLLPSAQQQSVGPFIFFDHFGPVTEQPGTNHDVRPHPHIGLATVTYLFEGAMMHRDSLGSAQRIEPGAINWMTAGRGIVHSERAPDDLRGTSYVNHGLQLWAALPKEFEETAPGFSHTPAETIPSARWTARRAHAGRRGLRQARRSRPSPKRCTSTWPWRPADTFHAAAAAEQMARCIRWTATC
jgi:redox-sensitive bicupin YhaK (pirin superfamily)